MLCSITKTAVAVVRCADKLLAVCKSVKKNGVPPNNLEEIIKECMDKFLVDVLALTGHTAKDMARKRRDLHCSNLPEGMAGICNSHIPMTSEWLYPHELEFYTALNEAKAQAKLVNQMHGKQHPQHNYQGHLYGHGQRYEN